MKNQQEEVSFFDLDDKRLDEEWNSQPQLYYNWGVKLADAKAAVERAKASRDLVYAELNKDIRSDPVKYDLPKTTESLVESIILIQDKYKLAHEKYIAAKHKMDVLTVTVEALDHRKKALENLVHLFGMNYFSEPKGPRGMREEEVKDLHRKISGKQLGKSREEVSGRRKHSG